MSEQAGEKTEQATPRRLEDAIKRGQFPRSAEVQTVFALLGGLLGLKYAGGEIWQKCISTAHLLGHLHEIELNFDVMQSYAIRAALLFGTCVGPVFGTVVLGGLLAGGLQSRFQTASEALAADWSRVDPMKGFQRILSARAVGSAGLSLLKLLVLAGLSYSQVKSILKDPIFYTGVDTARISQFLTQAAFGVTWRIIFGLMILAALDYTHQFWRTTQDLMMTKDEVKEEMKNSEGNPQQKARQRRRRSTKTQRQMLAEVPEADVVITNPTHLAVALRYDRKTMRAPQIVAKGSRLNALRIRELAAQHQVPIIENKPLARLMFKHGRVGGAIPAELYSAVAEVLAYVYRVNRYRYYTKQNQT